MGQLVAHNGGSARVPTVRRAPDDQGSAIPNGPADLNIYARPLAPVNVRICRFGCALGSEAILLRARLVSGRDQPRNGFAEVRLAGGTCATEPPEWPAMGGAAPGDTGTASIGSV